VLGAISGAVAGLVVITPASGFVTPMCALVMGAIGGIVCFFAATGLKHALGYDDSLDAFGVHGVGGTVGALLTGVFATRVINDGISSTFSKLGGVYDGHMMQLGNQFVAAILTWALAAIGSFILLRMVNAMAGLRVSAEDEFDGLDITQHGESGYNMEEGIAGATLIRDSIDMTEREQANPLEG
jgi:ammonium transporter, Amt family